MLSILRFGVCRSSDLSIHVQRNFPRTNALLQPSLRAMTALPMTGFHRAQDLPCTENNTLEIQLLSESSRALAILNVQTADPATDSFRVRDLHPIPLFSEQACVSDCSGRAFATKAMVCNFSVQLQSFPANQASQSSLSSGNVA